jgi:phosphatidylinositol alpha-1,6-mannosyltransferase
LNILVVTNDFPPRIGGINYYVDQHMRRFPEGTVTIFSSRYRGWEEFDAEYPHPVVRLPTEMMLPTPGTRRRLHEMIRAERPDLVLFGAAWPLGHMGPAIKRKLGVPYAAFSHGLELTGALVPGLLRHIGRDAALITSASEWAHRKLGAAFGLEGRMPVLPSGIDPALFNPEVSDAVVRERHGLGDAPVICFVSRLVQRKGADMLIAALPRVAAEIPGVKLLIVGHGPDEGRLRRLTSEHRVTDRVVFAGAAPYAELAQHFRAGNVFAMPCRSRRMGLDIEALGAVFLQGAAVGRPVIAGDSGGAPEAVQHGKTGLVVDPTSVPRIASALIELLGDPARAAAMGAAGAAWMQREWTWDLLSEKLMGLLGDSIGIAAGKAGTGSR